ncbi:MAG TPA: hypothetical protein DHW02_05850 [Ktedonobacter sp.]|nr:hypothetical protein [Ktedonobacter sp.]
MERRDGRLFQHDAINEGWNIVELESHRQFRHKINELISIAHASNMTTHDVQQHMCVLQDIYSHRLATHLVRTLQRDDPGERQTIVWLFTLLDEQQQRHAIPLLQQLVHNKQQSRAIRLSASLALAGMGATEEVTSIPRKKRLYAIS